MEIALVVAIIAVIFVVQTLKIVPQQHAWVVERLGKYDRTLTRASASWCRSSSAWRTSTP